MSSASSASRTMRVVLQITDGPDLGRKILLRSRHELKVGRTSWADFVCEHDSKMSRVHFKLITDSVGCYLEDLQSSNGTLLNGEKISSGRLKHGDRIRAGNTTFLVHLEGDRPNLTGSYVGSGPAASGPAGTPAPGKLLYGKKQCFSGLMQFSVATELVPPATLAEQIAKTWPLFLMADFNRMMIDPPEDLQRAELVFNWLPAPVAEQYPVFFSQTDTSETFGLLAEFFAKDSLICLFSKANRGQLLEHLRISARSRLHGDDDSGGMFGICWPSVLGAMLPSGDPSLIDRIMTSIEAVLLYRPDAPEKGLIFGDESLEILLQAAGYDLDPDSAEPDAEMAEKTRDG
jgi:hypothetical protein